MKTLSIIAAILISISSFVYAANEEAPTPKTTTLSGQVFDKSTGEALAGVKIQLDNTDKVVYTDFDGNFEIKNVVPGQHNITTSLISYSDSKVKVECTTHSNDIEITLENK